MDKSMLYNGVDGAVLFVAWIFIYLIFTLAVAAFVVIYKLLRRLFK